MPATADSYFAIIPEWVLDEASPQAIRVYGYLSRYADKQDHNAWPSIGTLAERAGTSEPTIRRALAELAELGAVIITPRYKDSGEQTSNLYTLIRFRGDTGDRGQGDTDDRGQGDTDDRGQGVMGGTQNRVILKQSQLEPESLTTPTPTAKPIDELANIFGKPTDQRGWKRYQKIVNLAKGHPPGEITRRAERHAAGYDFALTVGSLEKRWDELGGRAAEMNTLTIRQRKELLAASREPQRRAAEREQLRAILEGAT